MQSTKQLLTSLSVMMFLFILCLFFQATAVAADSPAVDQQQTVASGQGEKLEGESTPPIDYADPDTYITFAQIAKEWIIANLPHMIVALVIFVVGRMLTNWITGMARKAFHKADVEPTLSRFLCKLLYYTLMVGVLIAVAGELGIQTTSFLAIIGAAGLAVGLALKDSLSNFASGVMLILFRPFKVGDLVTVAGVTGKVFQVDIFSTVILTGDNQRQIIPNATITSGVITNINAEKTRRVDLIIGIGYDDNIPLAKSTLEGLMEQDSRILTEPAAAVTVANLGASSVDLAVRPWVKTEDYWAVRGELIEAIKLSFDAKGISFPYPQQDVHIFQEEK